MDGFGRRTMVICYKWTEVDGERTWTVHLMDGFGRRTMVICYKWTEVDGGRTRTVHLMDGFGRRTIKILKMWTEVDGWTDGQKSVRGGLLRSSPPYTFRIQKIRNSISKVMKFLSPTSNHHNEHSFGYITLSSSSHISTDGRSKWWRWWLKILCFKYIWVITSNYENIFDSTENLIYISREHFDELSDKLKFDWVTNPHPVLVLSSSSVRTPHLVQRSATKVRLSCGSSCSCLFL